ncbi:complex I subunit 4 family protein [Calycomorphotria hydatis]|uniref:NADH-quinone oxidoreductase subunit M n=1 Tax=Calycomorphotria hydatis TaxID=2528027 RepID=A0A517T6P0_9PLAN|nr:NADH-quinone oxidoreductase subunit M [Calycomorphotria hydatis]QDT64045.1 NADH-quinone oxidoreductase subunit M [Calycomorphotria hydatis]
MSDAFLLSLVIFLPALGAIALLGFNSRNVAAMRGFATLVTGAVFLLTLYLIPAYNSAEPNEAGYRLAVDLPWIPMWNIGYRLGIDGLSLPLLILTSLISFLGMLASWNIEKQLKGYLILYLLLESGMLGVFLALDFFLFYVFFEVMLLPMYFLIGIWGGPRKEYAAIKFFLYTLVGSILMLIVMLMTYFASGTGAAGATFDFATLAAIGQGASEGEYAKAEFSLEMQQWAFGLLLVAFLIKLPAVPFHTWLPDAHVEAPTPISMILAGVLLKIGGYGLLRVAYPLFPLGAYWASSAVVTLGVVSILYGAFAALAQTDFKRLVAYSSVSHMGYVLLGIGVWSLSGGAAERSAEYWLMGLNGAIYQMIGHGITSAGMFFMVGVIYDRVHHRNLSEFGGLMARMPLYAGLSVGIFFAGMGLPGMCGFIGEAFTVLASWNYCPIMAALAASGIILTAGYILWALQRVYLGPRYTGPHSDEITPITSREATIGWVLLTLAIVFGVYPRLVFDVTTPTTERFVKDLSAAVSANEQIANSSTESSVTEDQLSQRTSEVLRR